MQRTVSLRLVDAPEVECSTTAVAYRNACRLVGSIVAGGERPNTRALQRAHYATVRASLPAQMSVSVFRTVAGTWKSWKSNGAKGHAPAFKRPVAVFQHDRDWSLKTNGTVSFRVLCRRVRLRYQTSPTGHERLATARATGGLGGACLVHKRKGWFLDVSVTLPTAPAYPPSTTVGVDLGINTLAVARAPGKQPLILRGGDIRRRRNDSHHTRRRVQAKGTRSARRALMAQRGRETRFVLDACRVAARDIVQYAKTHHAIIRLEDLTHIRLGKRWGRLGNRRLHSWAFRTLQRCVADRAEAEGVPLAWVRPAYTSQTCPGCGHTAESNREASWFRCGSCGYQNHADVVGATNIALTPGNGMLVAARAPVNVPHGPGDEDGVLLHACPTLVPKPPISIGGS